MVLQGSVEESKWFQSIYSHCNLPSQPQHSTSIDFDSDAENVPATTSCTAARFYKEDIRMLLQSQFTITMPPSNHERCSSNPPHGPSRLSSVSLEDEKDEEIACWKRAYHDALAEKTNKDDAEKKNLWVATLFKLSALILPVISPSLKTLGCGIPKLVSLFNPVKRVVQLADKHKLLEAGQLPDKEFSGLDEVEIKQLERR